MKISLKRKLLIGFRKLRFQLKVLKGLDKGGIRYKEQLKVLKILLRYELFNLNYIENKYEDEYFDINKYLNVIFSKSKDKNKYNRFMKRGR